MASACTPCTVVKVGWSEFARRQSLSETDALRDAVVGLGGTVRDDGDIVTVLDVEGGVVGDAWVAERGWEWRVGPKEGREFQKFANEVIHVLRNSAT